MVGGANYHKNQFNLATQGERQPGSSFKPFVLATALKENIAPSSILTSSKQVTINADGRLWEVNNYEGEALGPINLSQAIAYSDNSVFSQLTAIVGPRNVATTAHELGITSKLNGYFAIGLGAEPADAARDGARLCDRSPTAASASTGRSSGTSLARSRRSTSAGNRHVNEPGRARRPHVRPGGDRQPAPAGRRAVRDGPAAALPGWQVAGKTGRPRTTVTRGSSATRRSSSSPSGSGTPTSSCR